MTDPTPDVQRRREPRVVTEYRAAIESLDHARIDAAYYALIEQFEVYRTLREQLEAAERERDALREAHDIAYATALDYAKRLEAAERERDEWNDLCETARQERDAAEADRDALREAIEDALGRYQVTHIHTGLRAALERSGKEGA